MYSRLVYQLQVLSHGYKIVPSTRFLRQHVMKFLHVRMRVYQYPSPLSFVLRAKKKEQILPREGTWGTQGVDLSLWSYSAHKNFKTERRNICWHLRPLVIDSRFITVAVIGPTTIRLAKCNRADDNCRARRDEYVNLGLRSGRRLSAAGKLMNGTKLKPLSFCSPCFWKDYQLTPPYTAHYFAIQVRK